MGRLILHWVCVLALVALPLGGCSDETTATGGTGGSGDTGGSGGAAGTGGTAPQLPLELPEGVWTWVQIEGAECRDGSPAGVTILPRAGSSNLLIYLSGGPICINEATCGADSGAPLLIEEITNPEGHVFDDRPENPFQEWSYVSVPHCTDDYHAGDAVDVTVPGVEGKQQFVGLGNMALFLERLVPTFSTVSHVVLGGCSSGGQGAVANFPQVRRAFKNDVRVSLFVDAGTPIANAESTGILAGMISLWGAKRTMMAECGASCTDEKTFFVDHFAWLVDTYSASTVIGVSVHANDIIERAFSGLGEAEWLDHLESLRTDILEPAPNTGTFYVDATGHCMIRDGTTYSVVADGVTHAEWLAEVAAGSPRHLGSLP